MRISATIRGADSLSLYFAKLKEAAQFGLKAGVQEAGLLIETRAKELVPVDTGHLQESIHTVPVIDEPEHQAVAVRAGDPASNDWGRDPPYARRIEEGFSGTDRLGRKYDQPAQPYMRPAADELGGEARQAIKDSVYSELEAARARRR